MKKEKNNNCISFEIKSISYIDVCPHFDVEDRIKCPNARITRIDKTDGGYDRIYEDDCINCRRLTDEEREIVGYEYWFHCSQITRPLEPIIKLKKNNNL